MSHYWLVMPAAGSGRRFGSRKQHAALAGRTVLETALGLFTADQRCRGGSIVLAPDDRQAAAELRQRLPERFELVGGGTDRARSVYSGLAALAARAAAQDWVLVHDAARPCLSSGDLDRLLEQGAREAVGALLAVPVADTVKRAATEAPGAEAMLAGADTAALPVRTSRTESRAGLWLAQTPQMFRYAPLREALERAAASGRTPTDEAQAIEWLGHSVQLVQAHDSNPKVTNAADLALAAAILRIRAESAGEATCG